MAAVGIANAHTALREILQHSAAMDVATAEHCLLAALKRLVLYELYTMTIIDERIAGNAGLFLVGFGETAVDDEASALGTYRRLALDGANGYMAVDDTPRIRREAKLDEDALAYVAAICQFVVGTLAFVPGSLVG